MKVNKWTQQQVELHILESFEIHKERSKHQWGLDISILAEEPYNIKLKNTTTRIFEVKKFKKKRKRSKPKVKKKINKRPPKNKQ